MMLLTLFHDQLDSVRRAGPEAGDGVGGHLEPHLDVAVLHGVVLEAVLLEDMEDKVPGQ